MHVDWPHNFPADLNLWKILDFEFLSFLWLGIVFFRDGKWFSLNLSSQSRCSCWLHFPRQWKTSGKLPVTTSEPHNVPALQLLNSPYPTCGAPWRRTAQLTWWCRYSFSEQPFQRTVILFHGSFCGINIVFSWEGNKTRTSWMFFWNDWFEMKNLGFSNCLCHQKRPVALNLEYLPD